VTEAGSPTPAPSLGSRAELATITVAKTASNMSLRWIPAFLPTIASGIGVGIGTMATLLSVAELTGLGAVAVGRRAAVAGERRLIALGLVVSSLGCLVVAAVAHPAAFLLGYAGIAVGGVVFVTAGHLWIGGRYPFAVRGRAMALFETSWASSLLIGAPTAAVVIAWSSWRGPFVTFAVIGFVASALVLLRLRDNPVHVVPPAARAQQETAGATRPKVRAALPAGALATVTVTALVWSSAVAVFTVFGAWFDREFGFGAGTIGVAAVALAVTELGASGAATVFTDRWGPPRAVRRGILGMALALLGIAVAGDQAWVGVLALVVFLGTYEFGFVSGLALATEVDRSAPGRVIGLTHTVGTISRAGGAVCGGWLFERWGMSAVALFALCTATLAAVALRRVTRVLTHVSP
jgi:predicted MFS family arabinose efflux permease